MAAESVVDMGMRLLARPPEPGSDVAAAREAAMELREATTSSAMMAMLDTILGRIKCLEEQLALTHQQVLATRVRRPVRDEIGTILYVVDEVQAPIWAQSVSQALAEHEQGEY